MTYGKNNVPKIAKQIRIRLLEEDLLFLVLYAFTAVIGSKIKNDNTHINADSDAINRNIGSLISDWEPHIIIPKNRITGHVKSESKFTYNIYFIICNYFKVHSRI
jgi:hypothetical protein